MDTPLTKLDLVVAHHDAQTRSLIVQTVNKLGHRAVAVVGTGKEIIHACERHRPNVVISGVQLSDIDGIQALTLAGATEPIPGIIVTPLTDLALVEVAALDHVMAWLLEPLRPEEIGPTLILVHRRGEEFALLRQQNDDLRMALADRKVIERAKGILMKSLGLDEAEAFRQLQKSAKDQRKKLAEVARAMVETHEPPDR